ncbi:MAG: hypothetical protein M3Q30_27785, partial [Actinomycetota bacterium]|nr:hypothetical protein [Actinomycetota bacterium]
MKNRLSPARIAALALTLAVVSFSSLGVAQAGAAPISPTPAGDQPPNSADHLGMPTRKRPHSVPRVGESHSTLDVKFAEGTDVRVRGGRLVSQGSGRIAALDDVLARFAGTRVTRLFDAVSEDQHARSRQDAVVRSGRPQADLNLYFRLETGPTTDITSLVGALNALDIVENAAPEPVPAPPPVTPSYVSLQGYRAAAASGGVDALYAQTVVGGKGENV